LTLRELSAMARGRQKDAWNHTAQLLAKMHNVNQIEEAGLLRPIDFHPYYDEEQKAAEKPPREKGSIAALAMLLVGTRPPA
jgi:hypothetical protein